MILRALTLAIVISAGAGDAHAQGLCDRINGMMMRETAQDFALPAPMNTQTSCSLSRTLAGGKAHHCGWPFAFRAHAAGEAFQALQAAVTDCLGGEARVLGDQDVNHPDTYDLQIFRIDQGTVSVSLKDKGALQQTYVFLRVERRPE